MISSKFLFIISWFGALLLVSGGIGVAQPGAADPGFSASVLAGGVTAWYHSNFQYDGRMLIAGSFNIVNGQPSKQIVRLTGSGLADPTFGYLNVPVATCLEPTPDGGWLAATASGISNYAAASIEKLGPDGKVERKLLSDNSDSAIRTIRLLPEGRLLVCGGFGYIAGGWRTGIARLNGDGSHDTTFNANLTIGSGVRDMAIQADGKILVYGTFPKGLARLFPDGANDTAFAPVFSYTGYGAFPFDVQIQRDGKIIAVGAFDKVDGVARNNIVRLNVDGSVDESFACNVTGDLDSASLLEGGQILITGNINAVNGVPRDRRARINADGSLDLSYNTGESPYGQFSSIDPEGRIFLSNGNRLLNSPTRSEVKREGNKIVWEREGALPDLVSASFEVRSAPDGAWTNLGQPARNGSFWEIDGVSLPATGAVRVRGTGHGAQRMGEAYLSLGSETPVATLTRLSGEPLGVLLEMGSVIASDDQTREFLIKNPTSRTIPAISLDLSGVDAAAFTVMGQSHETLAPYESIRIQVRFIPDSPGIKNATVTVSSADPSFAGLNLALQGLGSTQYQPIMEETEVIPFKTTDFDASSYSLGPVVFNYSPNGGSTYRILQSTGMTPIRTFSNAPVGARVTGIYQGHSYEFDVLYVTSGNTRAVDIRMVGTRQTVSSYNAGLNSYGGALAMQADGKMILSGAFTSVGGVARQRIARLMPSGSLDPNFKGSSNLAAENILPLKDGRILIGGNFVTVDGQPRRGIARLNHNGSLDQSFDLELDSASVRLLELPDGKVLVGGSFLTVKGLPKVGLVRLLPDGEVDQSFGVEIFDGAPTIFSLAVQSDGKILVGGNIKIAGGYRYLVRLESSGGLDESFQPQADSAVSALVVLKSGQILAGGHFTSIGGQARSKIARLNPDGTCDQSFARFTQLGGGGVSCLAVQKDGGIMASGTFNRANGIPRAGYARLHPDGEVDASFNTGSQSSPFIWGILLADDGSIFVSGEFSAGLTKLASSGASDFNVVNGSDLVWQQSGSAPELASVIFGASEDGVTWTYLGQGLETDEGWKLESTTLPATGFVRAVGRELVSNRGFAEMRKFKLVGREATALESWRSTMFGSMFSENDGADSADADGDGVKNLVEYGLGLDAVNSASSNVPLWTLVDGAYETGFTKPVSAEGVSYGAEWSETLQEGDWHPAEDLSDGNLKKFRGQTGALPKLFFRLKVSNP